MADYGIYLSVDDGAQGFRLPVNPPESEVEIPGQGRAYRIISVGEINMIQMPSLSEISFESFFPAQRYPFVVGEELLEPSSYVEMIDEWRSQKKIIRLIVTDGTVDINMLASIEDFTLYIPLRSYKTAGTRMNPPFSGKLYIPLRSNKTHL